LDIQQLILQLNHKNIQKYKLVLFYWQQNLFCNYEILSKSNKEKIFSQSGPKFWSPRHYPISKNIKILFESIRNTFRQKSTKFCIPKHETPQPILPESPRHPPSVPSRCKALPGEPKNLNRPGLINFSWLVSLIHDSSPELVSNLIFMSTDLLSLSNFALKYQ
jgi:hypothetical protein